jgi:hypothetical protein
MNKIKQQFKRNAVKIYSKEPATLDELAELVIAVINLTPRKSAEPAIPVKVVGFSWNITHISEVSNSHDAPINGETNWSGRDSNVPTGYPGWKGRVWIRFNKDHDASWHDGFASDHFPATLTYTGTGGAGAYNGPWSAICSAWYQTVWGKRKSIRYPEPECLSWDYRFFDSDWPMLMEGYEKQRVWDILSDRDTAIPTHNFLWEDPEVKAADQLFLNTTMIQRKAMA